MSNATTLPFTELLKSYSSNLQANLRKVVDTGDDPNVSMADWLTWRKIDKHLTSGNQRKAAEYLVMRLEEIPAHVSGWLRSKLETTPLRVSRAKVPHQILFQNDKGEWRAFAYTRAKE